MTFVAFDFETANETRRSPCAVGLAWVEEGRVVRSQSWLIRPPELRFARINTAIHGIAAADVAAEPEFPARWPLLREALVGKPVIAHNAAFDCSVLRATLDHYGIPYPELEYLCTWKLAKAAWPGFCNYRLDTVAAALGIRFSHHVAEADAVACAEIALRIKERTGQTSIREAADALGILPGRLYEGGYGPCRSRGAAAPSNREGPLAGLCFVFTGALESMVRREAQALVAQRGGIAASHVSPDTSYLVIGQQAYSRFVDGKKSAKLKAAESLIAQGHAIEIVSEADFLEILGE